MDDKLLTVIVPAYNVEKYIEDGLDSLIQDSSIIGYLDIIVVNDGSTDRTSFLAHRIADRYPDSIRVIDKENGGHGSGLNIGIKEARGVYLKVLDGDDRYDTQGLSKLMLYILNDRSRPDIIVNPYEKVWEDGKRRSIRYDAITPERICGYKEINRSRYSLCLPSMTIRTEIFRANDIKMIDEKISYDDMEYDLYIVPFVKRIVFLQDIIYQYRYGLSDQSMDISRLQKNLPMHCKMIDSLVEYYQDNSGIFTEEQKKYYLHELVNTIGVNCNIRISMDADKGSLVGFLKKYDTLPLTEMENRKVRFLLKTKFAGYKLILWYHHLKRG